MRRTSFGGEAGVDDATAGSPVAAVDAAAEHNTKHKHNNKNTNANNSAASSVVSSVNGEIIADFILTELKVSGREIHLSCSFSAHHSTWLMGWTGLPCPILDPGTLESLQCHGEGHGDGHGESHEGGSDACRGHGGCQGSGQAGGRGGIGFGRFLIHEQLWGHSRNIQSSLRFLATTIPGMTT